MSTTTAAAMIATGIVYDTIAEAKEAVTSVLLNANLSYRVHKTDATRLMLKCRSTLCSFYVRIGYSKKLFKAMVTIYKPHTCPRSVHNNFRPKKSVKYLKSLHAPAILENRFAVTTGMSAPPSTMNCSNVV